MHQLRIELRRNLGPWLFVPLLILAWFFFSGRMFYYQTLLWVEASVAVRNSIFFVGPCIATAAAWMAGREDRRGSSELLVTMPQPPLSRHLLCLAATILWGVGAYLLIAAILLALTARRATWGGPILWPPAIGLLALCTFGAIGFALGKDLPSRFTAPLVGVAVYFAQAFFAYGSFGALRLPDERRFGWLVYLSPTVQLGGSPWYGLQPNIGWQQATFLLGLGGLAIGGLALRERRSPVSWLALCGAAVLTVGGIVAVYLAAPAGTARERVIARAADPTVGLIPFTPVCRGEPFLICVHPAYRPWLEENVGPINRAIAPLLGLPGVPTRAEQGSPLFDWEARETLLVSPQPDVQSSVATAVNQLLIGPSYPPEGWRRCPDGTGRGCSLAREAITIWLLRQAGQEPERVWFPETSVAADRFGALPEAERREWLRANFVALREWRATLAMFP